MRRRPRESAVSLSRDPCSSSRRARRRRQGSRRRRSPGDPCLARATTRRICGGASRSMSPPRWFRWTPGSPPETPGIETRTADRARRFPEPARGIEAHREGLGGGVADLLLVMPFLRVFPGDVEPVPGHALTRPGDSQPIRIGLERIQEVQQLFIVDRDQLHEDPGADASHAPHEVPVVVLDECDQVGGVDDRRCRAMVSVPDRRDPPEASVEQMRRQILHVAVRVDRRSAPVLRGETPEQLEQAPVHLAERLPHRDHDVRVQTKTLHVHGHRLGCSPGLALEPLAAILRDRGLVMNRTDA